jgi:hypothetical protein
MTIQTIQDPIPDSFPPAKLFLDDLSEIAAIFSELVETIKPRGATPEELKINFTFSCAGRMCTTFEEVPKILKPFREFELRIGRSWMNTTLRCSPFMGSRWYASSAYDEAEVSSAYRRLKPIFERRKRHASAAARSVPFWIWIILNGLTPLLLAYLSHLLAPRIGLKLATTLEWLLPLVYFFLLLIGWASHTTLLPRNSYEPSPVRKLIVEKTVPTFLAVLLGVLGTLLTQFLIHKIWPTH